MRARTDNFKKVYCIYATTLPRLFDLVNGFPLLKLDAHRTVQEEPPIPIETPPYVKLKQHTIKSLKISYRRKKHAMLPSRVDLLTPLSQVDGIAIVDSFAVKLERPYGDLINHRPIYATFKHKCFGPESREVADTDFKATVQKKVDESGDWHKKDGYKLSTLDLDCLQTEDEWKHPRLGAKVFNEETLHSDDVANSIRESLRLEKGWDCIRTYRVAPTLEWELIKTE